MLILASASPRRQELLQQIHCEYRILVSNALEIADSGYLPEKLAMENAQRKAVDVSSREKTEVPVLGADTVVAVDHEVLGKPTDENDAARMLRLLSGRKHDVYTGIAIAYQGNCFVSYARTSVWMDIIPEDEILSYVATGEPLDKAGAYAVQGRAAQFIPRIEGSFSNVVGLPLHELRILSRKAGILL